MGKLIFVTGGARSGKSTFAENMAKEGDRPIVYVATGKAIDEEMKQRIDKHKAQRSDRFMTVEAYRDLADHIKPYAEEADAILLDCVTIMVCNIMFDIQTNWDEVTSSKAQYFEEQVQKEINDFLDYVKETDKKFIVVSNELGMGLVPEYPSSRLYRDVAGRANQMIAKASDEAYLLVSSLPVRLK